MAGMFQSKYWNPKLVRVLDRCYYFPEARSSGLNFINEKELKTTASTYFLPKQTKLALKKGLIPFWSIYGKKRRFLKVLKYFLRDLLELALGHLHFGERIPLDANLTCVLVKNQSLKN